MNFEGTGCNDNHEGSTNIPNTSCNNIYEGSINIVIFQIQNVVIFVKGLLM